jgi:hypothetical protein
MRKTSAATPLPAALVDRGARRATITTRRRRREEQIGVRFAWHGTDHIGGSFSPLGPLALS